MEQRYVYFFHVKLLILWQICNFLQFIIIPIAWVACGVNKVIDNWYFVIVPTFHCWGTFVLLPGKV